jgi:hypothetical protein
VGPDGQWIAGPSYGREELVFAEIDLDRVAEEQQVLDTAGHYNRPDVFALTIDTHARRQVTWSGTDEGTATDGPGGRTTHEEESHGH